MKREEMKGEAVKREEEREMDVVEILKNDYSRFPNNQTYSIYAEDIYFKDPLSQFRGRALFKRMLQFMDIFFLDVKMDLHGIDRTDDQIKTQWTLSWNTPLPWKPRIHIDGWSELNLDPNDQIISQIDYWNCSRLNVFKQHFGAKPEHLPTPIPHQ